ncbi:Cytochrome P450 [Macleaya cordata]|uniref:Cytochrome P450 n=1 Tax=Macleaya cordata TaxID=56857 RepID=A0A200QYA4_MACCD|nr:Cytochrome P450 [Macleaya cordata]
MDSDHHHLNYQFSAASLIMVVLLALLVYYLLSILKSSSKNRELLQAPEPAGSWPLIGHLHLLGGRNQLLHKTLGAMADEYGPAFTIRIGFHRALVISSWEVVKDCFTTNDRVLASRPRSTALKHMCYNYAMSGFGPYGPYWRELRKIVNQELLSNTRIELLKHVWDSEISTSIKELYDEVNCADTKNKEECGQVLVDMKRWFTDLTLNISVKMVAGKRYFGGGSSSKDQGEAERLKKGMRDFFRLVSQFVASDAIPFLEWLDLGGYVREMKSTARELDCLLEGWLEEHKMKRQSKKAGEQDFMDVMLSKLEDAELYGFDPDTVNKATCLVDLKGFWQSPWTSTEPCKVHGLVLIESTNLYCEVYRLLQTSVDM